MDQEHIAEEIKKLREDLERFRSELRIHETRLQNLEERSAERMAQERFVRKEGEVLVPPPPPPFVEIKRGMLGGIIRKAEEGMGEHADWESLVGGNLLTKVGAAALVVGVGFFIKYAFDNQWIGETARIILGVITGMVLMGFGEYWKEKYGKYAQTLTGGGIAILYLSIYSAFAFYSLIGVYPAFLLMSIVTLAAGVLAVRYNSAVIAFLGIVGGYLTPLFLYKDFAKNEAVLISYITLLNFCVIGIASFRNWRSFTFVSFLLAHLLFIFWYNVGYTEKKLFFAEFTLTVFFLQYALVTILYHLFGGKKAENPDAVLIAANAAVYFGWSYALLQPKYEVWLGFLAVVLALFYFVLGYLAYLMRRDDPRLTLTLSGASIVFLTIAVPIQLKQQWITMAWAAEGLVLSWLGFYLKSYHLRIFSLGVFFLVLVRLFGFDMQSVSSDTFVLIFNKRFFVFLVSIAALYLAAYLWRLEKGALQSEERYVLPILILAANFLTLWILSTEVVSFYDHKTYELYTPKEATIYDFERCAKYGKAYYNCPQNIDYERLRDLKLAEGFSLSALWALYAIFMVAAGIAKKYRVVRLAGLALLWVVVFKVFLFDTSALTKLYRVGSYMSLGAILLVTGYLYQRYRDRIKEFLLES